MEARVARRVEDADRRKPALASLSGARERGAPTARLRDRSECDRPSVFACGPVHDPTRPGPRCRQRARGWNGREAPGGRHDPSSFVVAPGRRDGRSRAGDGDAERNDRPNYPASSRIPRWSELARPPKASAALEAVLLSGDCGCAAVRAASHVRGPRLFPALGGRGASDRPSAGRAESGAEQQGCAADADRPAASAHIRGAVQ